MKSDPPNKSIWPDHPTTCLQTLIRMDTDLLFYIFLGFERVMNYPFFVGYLPNPPDTYIKIKSNPTSSHFSLSLTYFLPLPPSRRHSFTASLRQSLTSQLTPSQRHFVNLSPHSSLRQIPRFPHGLTRSDPCLHSDLVCGFDFVFRLDFFVVLIWFLC